MLEDPCSNNRKLMRRGLGRVSREKGAFSVRAGRMIVRKTNSKCVRIARSNIHK